MSTWNCYGYSYVYIDSARTKPIAAFNESDATYFGGSSTMIANKGMNLYTSDRSDVDFIEYALKAVKV